MDTQRLNYTSMHSLDSFHWRIVASYNAYKHQEENERAEQLANHPEPEKLNLEFPPIKQIDQWLKTRWSNKKSIMRFIRAERPIAASNYQYNVLLKHIKNHNNFPVQATSNLVKLECGIEFRVDDGISGYIQLCREMVDARNVCVNSSIDKRAYGYDFQFLIYTGLSSVAVEHLTVKSQIFAEVIFDMPVAITEKIILGDDEDKHVVIVTADLFLS